MVLGYVTLPVEIVIMAVASPVVGALIFKFLLKRDFKNGKFDDGVGSAIERGAIPRLKKLFGNGKDPGVLHDLRTAVTADVLSHVDAKFESVGDLIDEKSNVLHTPGSSTWRQLDWCRISTRLDPCPP